MEEKLELMIKSIEEEIESEDYTSIAFICNIINNNYYIITDEDDDNYKIIPELIKSLLDEILTDKEKLEKLYLLVWEYTITTRDDCDSINLIIYKEIKELEKYIIDRRIYYNSKDKKEEFSDIKVINDKNKNNCNYLLTLFLFYVVSSIRSFAKVLEKGSVLSRESIHLRCMNGNIKYIYNTRSFLCPFIGSYNYFYMCMNINVCKTEEEFDKIIEEANRLISSKKKIKKKDEKESLKPYIEIFTYIIELSRGCMCKQMLNALKKLDLLDHGSNKCINHNKHFNEIIKLSFALASRMVYRKYESVS